MAQRTKPAAKPRRSVATAHARPDFWLTPTDDPDVVIRCDWNQAEQRYNRNCREVRLDDVTTRLRTEMKRVTNAMMNNPVA